MQVKKKNPLEKKIPLEINPKISKFSPVLGDKGGVLGLPEMLKQKGLGKIPDPISECWRFQSWCHLQDPGKFRRIL